MRIQQAKFISLILLVGGFAATHAVADNPGSEPIKRSDLPLPVEVVGQDGPVEVSLGGESVNISGSVSATIDEPLEVTGAVDATIDEPLDVNVLSAPPAPGKTARPVSELKTLVGFRGIFVETEHDHSAVGPFSVLTDLMISAHVPEGSSAGSPCFVSVEMYDPLTDSYSPKLGQIYVGPGESDTRHFEFPEGLDVSNQIMDTFVNVGVTDSCFVAVTATGLPTVYFND